MRKRRFLVAAAVLLAAGAGASGYALIGSKWNYTPVTMHLELGGTGTLVDGSASWNAVATAALGTWNYYLLRLQFTPVIDSKNPGDRNGVNDVFFSNTIYGEDFGDAVAVTTEWDVPGNDKARSEADVIFNSTLDWNSYRGSFRYTVGGNPIYDLRRVALHEFGHVVGLDHPDDHGQSVSAIMNSHVSNIDNLVADDIRGGQFLYGAQPGTAPDIATIDRPRQKNPITGASSYLIMGSADPDRVRAIFLTNSRVGKTRFFKAKGLRQWKVSIPLKLGRNVVTLYVRGLDGVRAKVEKRIITRSAVD